ncbi:MAG: hypothetical protein IH945_00360 [Armatimonadetes bacterium]|nr:hypothetical protein [Armatimonadota bacterium]
MGRAWRCPKCMGTAIRLERLSFNLDLWSVQPRRCVETILAFRCKNCRHVVLIRPLDERPQELAPVCNN